MSNDTHRNPPGSKVNLPAECGVCGILRTLRLGACDEHSVAWLWWRSGHATPHDAAYAHLGALDEALGSALPSPLACVGSACVARLRDRVRPALEALAIGADRTRLDLLTALAGARKAAAS